MEKIRGESIANGVSRMKSIITGIIFLTLTIPVLVIAGYQEGRDAYDRGDYHVALREFKTLAEKNDARGQYALAIMYDLGNGVKQNSKEAVKYYQLAAVQGFADAQNNLGVMYDQADGVDTDYKEAMKWYLLAAERGNRDAPNNIGVLHMIGLGVPRSFAKAHTWFTIAGARDSEAISNKNFVKRRLSPEQLAESQRLASEWRQNWLKK